MAKFTEQYQRLWEHIKGEKKAHETAVGGDFDVVGTLELNLLKHAGLEPHHSLVDIGCGSGRLACKLANYSKGSYVGIDILPSLLDHARERAGRPDWVFKETDGQSIPMPDDSVDFISSFSVFTHITHEQTWQYILESKRVLKPGGKLVCSFLEFRIRSHWWVFNNTFCDKEPRKMLNQFLSRDAFEAFAYNSKLEVASFFDGDKPHIPIDKELIWDNGVKMSGMGNLGQSICILRKPNK